MRGSYKTVIFWGAGATALTGMRTTAAQGSFLRKLVGKPEGKRTSLTQRVRDALHPVIEERSISAFDDLLTILGDCDENDETEDAVFSITEDRIDAMRRNWRTNASEEDIRRRIVELCALYDWPALKRVIEVCPKKTNGDIDLTDLFNVLDMHIQSGHGFNVKQDLFLAPQRILAARNALKMLLLAMFYVDWSYARKTKREHIFHHYEFAAALGRRMQRQGLELAGEVDDFDDKKFYMGDVSFASLNYDPIALWCQFVANRDLNKSPSVPHIGYPARKLKIFHDLGHFVSGPHVGTGRLRTTPYHPMNEAAAQRLNDDEHDSGDRIRIGKFLLPHGCLWWRECPNCGKLSSYMGDSTEDGAWVPCSPTLIPPPPLRAFVEFGQFAWRAEDERKAWDEGEVDMRVCVHCEARTYAHHTRTVMQSNFKSSPPPFLEEIKRDLRVAVQGANHIVLMGYSLPPDDFDYRAFFAARRSSDSGKSVKCSVVVGTKHDDRWFSPSEWPALLSGIDSGESPCSTLKAARDLFGEEHVRFYGHGIPQVFLDGGRVTDAAVERLLNWKER